MMLCSVRSVQGKQEEERTFLVMVVSSKADVSCTDTQLSRKWLDACLLIGSGEEILFSLFFLYLCGDFASLTKTVAISACKTSHLPSVFSLSCRRGEQASSSVGVCLGSTQHSPQLKIRRGRHEVLF